MAPIASRIWLLREALILGVGALTVHCVVPLPGDCGGGEGRSGLGQEKISISAAAAGRMHCDATLIAMCRTDDAKRVSTTDYYFDIGGFIRLPRGARQPKPI